MKTIKFIVLFMLLCGTVPAQRNRDPRRELDSLKQIVLSPKLKQYDQQVEKFSSEIRATTDKHRIKQYAKEIVQVSRNFEDEIATLYDGGYGRGNVYVGAGMGMGMGMGPWLYPGMGGWMYPGSYSYNNLPPLYYEVDRIKRYANNMRIFTGANNVCKQLNSINKKVKVLEGI